MHLSEFIPVSDFKPEIMTNARPRRIRCDDTVPGGRAVAERANWDSGESWRSAKVIDSVMITNGRPGMAKATRPRRDGQ
jgi:hypothetical protein